VILDARRLLLDPTEGDSCDAAAAGDLKLAETSALRLRRVRFRLTTNVAFGSKGISDLGLDH